MTMRLDDERRSDFYYYGSTDSRITDLLKAKPSYLNENLDVLKSGRNFLEKAIKGCEFLFEGDSSGNVIENINILYYCTNSGLRVQNNNEPYLKTLKSYFVDVKKQLEKLIESPQVISTESFSLTQNFFSNLSHYFYSKL